MTFVLTSSAFPMNGSIPRRYTGDGDDCSPPLQWQGAPERTRSFALFVTDPDAPSGLFHHWALLNIPPDFTGLPEGFPDQVPLANMQELLNGFGHEGYGGPLPPHGHGPHRYVFQLLALAADAVETVPREDIEALLPRLEPMVLDRAELIGLYER